LRLSCSVSRELPAKRGLGLVTARVDNSGRPPIYRLPAPDRVDSRQADGQATSSSATVQSPLDCRHRRVGPPTVRRRLPASARPTPQSAAHLPPACPTRSTSDLPPVSRRPLPATSGVARRPLLTRAAVYLRRRLHAPGRRRRSARASAACPHRARSASDVPPVSRRRVAPQLPESPDGRHRRVRSSTVSRRLRHRATTTPVSRASAACPHRTRSTSDLPPASRRHHLFDGQRAFGPARHSRPVPQPTPIIPVRPYFRSLVSGSTSHSDSVISCSQRRSHRHNAGVHVRQITYLSLISPPLRARTIVVPKYVEN